MPPSATPYSAATLTKSTQRSIYFYLFVFVMAVFTIAYYSLKITYKIKKSKANILENALILVTISNVLNIKYYLGNGNIKY